MPAQRLRGGLARWRERALPLACVGAAHLLALLAMLPQHQVREPDLPDPPSTFLLLPEPVRVPPLLADKPLPVAMKLPPLTVPPLAWPGAMSGPGSANTPALPAAPGTPAGPVAAAAAAPHPSAHPDARQLRLAIGAALAEAEAARDKRPFVRSAPPPDKYQRFAVAFHEARVPDCIGKDDALRLDPPEVKLGGVKVGLGGVFALPFLAHAALTGKCK